MFHTWKEIFCYKSLFFEAVYKHLRLFLSATIADETNRKKSFMQWNLYDFNPKRNVKPYTFQTTFIAPKELNKSSSLLNDC